MEYSAFEVFVNQRLGDLETLVRLAMAGAGGGGSDLPFSRFKWIDGGTTATSHNGSVQLPYGTISQFLTGIPTSTTAADSQAIIVGLVTPAVTGYVENLVIPGNRNIELKAENVSIVTGSGSSVTGNVTWTNGAASPNHAPTTIALLNLHNVPVSGNVTVIDDGTVLSDLFIEADEGLVNASVGGNIVGTGATALNAVLINGAIVLGTINVGTATATVSITGSGAVAGLITCKFLTVVTGTVSSVTFAAGSTTSFSLTSFTGTPVVTGGNATTSTALFDGNSWQKFQEQGGTVATAITMVVGGYSGGAVAGAALSAANGINANVSVGLNGTGASAAFVGGGNWYTVPAATLTGNRTVTLLTGAGEKPGDTILITRNDATNNSLNVANGGGGGGNVGVIPAGAGANTKGSILASFNGTNWVPAELGTGTT